MCCNDFLYIYFVENRMERLVNSLYQFSFSPLKLVCPVRVVWSLSEEEVSRSPISQRRMAASTPARRATLIPPSKRRPNSPYKVRSTHCLFLFMTDGKNWVTLLHANYGRQCSDKVFKSAFTPDGMYTKSFGCIWHRAHRK